MNTCKTCQHYSTDGYNELCSSGDCTLYPEWREVNEDHYCGQWLADKSIIDWNTVEQKFKWIAQDADGTICVYASEPVAHNSDGLWGTDSMEGEVFREIKCAKIPNPNWMGTKSKRP